MIFFNGTWDTNAVGIHKSVAFVQGFSHLENTLLYDVCIQLKLGLPLRSCNNVCGFQGSTKAI